VNANLYAAVTLPPQDHSGRTRKVEAVVDTGFNGYLTLPPMLLEDLELLVVGDGEALLADGSQDAFELSSVTVLWNGQPMYAENGASGVDALLGMALLDGHSLTIDVENGGRVLIKMKAQTIPGSPGASSTPRRNLFPCR